MPKKQFMNINNDFIFAIVIGSILLILLSVFIVAFTLVFLKKRKQNSYEQQKLKLEHQTIITQTQLEIREQTLADIGREIHENYNHTATIIKMHLITMNLEDINESNKKLTECKALIKSLILDLKELTLSINGDRVIELGLGKSLELEIERIKGLDIFNVTYDAQNPLPEIQDVHVIVIYRMLQELSNNTIKYSNANNVYLQLNVIADKLIITFTDDGVGFDDSIVNKKSGSGFINLRKRAQLIGAELSIDSKKNQGTIAKIILPITYSK